MRTSLPQCARAGQLDCIRLVPLPPSYLPCSVLSYFLPCCDKGACHKNCLTQWSLRLHHHAWHLYRVLGFELRSLDFADWVLPQPTVIIFLLMLTPSHRTDEAHTFSFLSKLQWSCGTSFMNSHIHWVPPSACLFADTLGLGKWKNCFPQVPDWWRKKNPASRGKYFTVLEVTDTVELGSRDLTAPPSFVLLVKQANFLQLSSTSHQHSYLEQTLWSTSALMIFNHTTGHAQPQRQGANHSPMSPDQT